MLPQEIKDTICTLIAEGKSLRAILREREGMPASSTVFKELAADKDFAEQYARAREAQADAIVDEILEIADDGRNDKFTDGDGIARTNQEVVARSRLRVDARKWMAGKLRPKVYGEKMELAGDQERPVKLVFEWAAKSAS
jgi:hypothetical protein